MRIEVEYRAEALWGEELEIETWVCGLRKSSMTLAQEARKTDGTLSASARVSGVWVGGDGKPMRMPRDLRAALATLDKG